MGQMVQKGINDRSEMVPDVHGIVAGVDGSPSSRLALTWAGRTAALYGVPLTVLFARPDAEGDVVISDDEHRTGGPIQPTVAEVRQAHPEVEVRSARFPQPPVQSLLLASQTADLLVIGSRGWDGFTGLLVGSTTLHVVPYAKCPVVVLHGPRPDDDPLGPPGPHRDEVVVAFDGSPESKALPHLRFGTLRRSVAASRRSPCTTSADRRRSTGWTPCRARRAR